MKIHTRQILFAGWLICAIMIASNISAQTTSGHTQTQTSAKSGKGKGDHKGGDKGKGDGKGDHKGGDKGKDDGKGDHKGGDKDKGDPNCDDTGNGNSKDDHKGSGKDNDGKGDHKGGDKGDHGNGGGDGKGDHNGGGKDDPNCGDKGNGGGNGDGNNGSGHSGDCEGNCFGTEVLSAIVNAEGCVEYELKITHGPECRYELSHFTVEVPCGTVGEISNSRGWKVEVGTDPTTGLSGFKIDDISNFGKGSDNSFTVKVTVCGDEDCEKRIGQVAYKAGQCVDYETPDYEIDNGGDNGGGDNGGGNTGGGDNGGGDNGGGDTGGGDNGGGDTGGGDNGGGTTCSTLIATIQKADATCFNSVDGQLTVQITAGAEPYEYHWSTGATTSSLSGLSAGSYSVTVTDADGNTITLTESISSPADINISKSSISPSCSGISNGAIDINVSGGTGPYTYSWNNGSTTEDLSNLPAGLLTVTVTDAHGCKKTSSTFLQNATSITTSGTLSKPTNCSTSNGAIDVSVTGGVSPYTYSWSNGSTSEDLANVAAGTYALTITDANGCQGFGNYNLIQASAMQTSFNVTPTACIDDTSGSIDLSVTGGVSPYTYSWSNGATTQDISALKTGIYRVTVTDASGCSQQTAINVPKKTIEVIDDITQPLCSGDATGSITVNPSEGSGSYSYNWSTGDNSGTADGLTGGTYTVTITDASGCSRTLQYTITQPQPLNASWTSSTSECGANGSFAVDLTVSGGKTPYTYAWSGGQTSQDISGINAGNYNVQITDANGCSTSTQVTIDGGVYQTPCSIIQPVSSIVCGSVGNSISSDIANASSYSWSVSSSDNSWSITSGANSSTAVFSAGNSGSSATFTLTLMIGGCTKTCTYATEANGCDVRDSDGGGDPNAGDPCDPDASNATASTQTQQDNAGKLSEESTDDSEPVVAAYPNPFESDVNIQWTAPRTEHVKLELFDALGNRVKEVYAGTVERGKQYSFECSNLGVKNLYIYRLTSGSRSCYGKIMKK